MVTGDNPVVCDRYTGKWNSTQPARCSSKKMIKVKSVKRDERMISETCPYLEISQIGIEPMKSCDDRGAVPGLICVFTCPYAGTTLIGPRTVTCLDSGKWSGTQPYCDASMLMMFKMSQLHKNLHQMNLLNTS